jgi:DNA-directed RNA polymerase subunit N (RpoN/RPB10)
VLDDLGIRRYCCRAAMLTSVDLMKEIAKFKK